MPHPGYRKGPLITVIEHSKVPSNCSTGTVAKKQLRSTPFSWIPSCPTDSPFPTKQAKSNPPPLFAHSNNERPRLFVGFLCAMIIFESVQYPLSLFFFPWIPVSTSVLLGFPPPSSSCHWLPPPSNRGKEREEASVPTSPSLSHFEIGVDLMEGWRKMVVTDRLELPLFVFLKIVLFLFFMFYHLFFHCAKKY